MFKKCITLHVPQHIIPKSKYTNMTNKKLLNFYSVCGSVKSKVETNVLRQIINF
ncbi:hypothetical protein Hanom_Chr01g00000301 [Helianthus anomalus]